MTKPLVYIASPYTSGDPAINTNFQCRIFDAMLTAKLATPIAPLWSHFQHTVFPRRYQDWIAYAEEIVARCDALVRLDAVEPSIGYRQSESSGADNEVRLARELGKPVFTTLDDLYQWIDTEWKCSN